MVLKRKRNLKIDSNAVYSVFLLKDLDPDELEDYVENRDTGMEADEEKEIHLQNIMKGSGSSIPLPVITEVNNISRTFYKKIDLNKKIEWKTDCSNEYIESKDDFDKDTTIGDNGNGLSETIPDLRINSPVEVSSYTKNSTDILESAKSPGNIQNTSHTIQLNIADATTVPIKVGVCKASKPGNKPDKSTLELLTKAGECKAFLNGRSEEVANFCLKRVLLRYERAGFETYTCFRDRIFHPTFKSRRNETLMMEKISRMGVEFATLKQLSQIYKEKCMKELLLMKKTVEIVKKAAILKFNRRQKKSVSRMLFEGLTKNAQGRPRLNIHAVMTDREKIQNIKNFKSPSELFLDIKYYDSVMGLVKCKEPKNGKI